MPQDDGIILIDGSYGEGGGQILRTSCALSAVTGKAIRIYNIRKNRKNPGLKTQHLIGIRGLNDLCNGTLKGDTLNSQEILFNPGNIQSKSLEIEIKTAGSIALVLQTLLLPSFFSSGPVSINFKGGATETPLSPTIDYYRFVFLRLLEKLGIKTRIKIQRRGFFPSGNSELSFEINPGILQTFNCTERGPLKKITIISGSSDHLRKAGVSERQAEAVEKYLDSKIDIKPEVKIEYYSTVSPGSQINIIAEFENTFIGYDGLGRPGKRAERVGSEAARKFLKEFNSNTCVDRYAADQIVPYLALARGESRFTASEITKHTKTNIWVIKKILKRKFSIESLRSGFVIALK